MAWPSTVTVPLLVTPSGLKGSSLWPSGFSESLSAFLSGGFEGAGAASRVVEQEKIMENASRPVPSFNRRIAFLPGFLAFKVQAEFSGAGRSRNRGPRLHHAVMPAG